MQKRQEECRKGGQYEKQGARQRIRHMLYGLPVIRGIVFQMKALEQKYEELAMQYCKLSEQCQRLQEKDNGLDYRIDDVYHEIFLNRKEIRQRYCQLLPKERYPEALKEWYFSETGKKLDLAHPKTFNEKIQWIKLYGLDERCTELADKYKVRAYITQRIGEKYLIPLLGVWDTFGEIDFDRLPKRFVLKANHGSGMNIVVKDKASFDRRESEKQFRRWMATDYAFYTGFELQYSAIPRKILAEEYLENPSGGGLGEYKIYCFHGEPALIGYYQNVAGGRSMAYFDLQWNRLPYQLKGYLTAGTMERPAQLPELIAMSRCLGQGFLFVRVDWYLLEDGRIKFGEMTFTSGSGIAARDLELDCRMGDGIHLWTDGEEADGS